jgi:PAS domain S-box-containing protein
MESDHTSRAHGHEEHAQALATLETRIHTLEAELSQTRQASDDQRSARELSDAALRRSESRFQAMFNCDFIGVALTDLESNISEANAAFLKMIGHDPADLQAGLLHWSKLTPPEWHAADLLAMERTKATGIMPARDKELYHKDGHRVPIRLGTAMIEGADNQCIYFVLDSTGRNCAELNRRFVSALEATQAAFALFDQDDRLQLCNNSYRRLVGSSLPDSLVGLHYQEIFDAWIGKVVFASGVERDRFVGDQRERERARRSGGAPRMLRMRDGRSLKLVDRLSAEGDMIEAVWDVTPDASKTAVLRQAQVTAEAASRAKSEFLSSMSHELRTPLNAILGFAQLLLRDRMQPLPERHRLQVGLILSGGEHLLRLIDDVLNLSRVEAGQISITLEPLSVPVLLDQVMSTLRPLAQKAGVTLELEPVSPEVPPIVVDRTRFAQVLINFGSNAIKYNRRKGSVRLSAVQLETLRLRFTVTDDGLGIATDKQAKLFQPFQRAGQEAGPIEGTGIGLFISKRLAELMQCEVGFWSNEGTGSEFWVDVPIDTSHTRAPEAVSPHASSQRSELGNARLPLLYIEDNLPNVAFMRDLVETFENLEFISAPTAETGLELARKHRPALIVMDVNLPGMSGIEAVRILQSLPDTEAIPVIALSAAASEHDKQRGLSSGFSAYLTKPLNVDAFISTVESLLRASVS